MRQLFRRLGRWWYKVKPITRSEALVRLRAKAEILRQENARLGANEFVTTVIQARGQKHAAICVVKGNAPLVVKHMGQAMDGYALLTRDLLAYIDEMNAHGT